MTPCGATSRSGRSRRHSSWMRETRSVVLLMSRVYLPGKLLRRRGATIASMEAISRLRWVAVTAVAPVAWGSTYVVTRAVLPPEPLWGAVLRALPAGLLLLLVARRR